MFDNDFDDFTFQNNMNIVYRKCCINDDCPVRFRVEHCPFLDLVMYFYYHILKYIDIYCCIILQFHVYQKANHNHVVYPSYHNVVGIDEFWEEELMAYVRIGLFGPKRILSDLTDEYGQRIRVNDEG